MDQNELTVIENLVGDFLEILGFKSSIDSQSMVEDEKNIVKVHIQGEDINELIGYHGKNLESLQRLINMAYNKEKEEFVSIHLDVNEYRQKREGYLKSLAERALIQVKESNQAITLPAMGASDRRIVHMILQDESGVETESEGEEPNRSVVIKPI